MSSSDADLRRVFKFTTFAMGAGVQHHLKTKSLAWHVPGLVDSGILKLTSYILKS
jgi:hypothetical protein